MGEYYAQIVSPGDTEDSGAGVYFLGDWADWAACSSAAWQICFDALWMCSFPRREFYNAVAQQAKHRQRTPFIVYLARTFGKSPCEFFGWAEACIYGANRSMGSNGV